MSTQPYVQIQDKHGAVASIFISPDNKHEVRYCDDKGNQFYTEIFQEVPIELIEPSVMDWALGKRNLL
jgi:hypothetical protein